MEFHRHQDTTAKHKALHWRRRFHGRLLQGNLKVKYQAKPGSGYACNRALSAAFRGILRTAALASDVCWLQIIGYKYCKINS